MVSKKASRRRRIRYGIRAQIKGTSVRPRLSIFRSNKEIYAQVIDDIAGHTLCASSSRELNGAEGNKTDLAKQVGLALARKAIDKGIESIVFDRGGYLYHGRVKSLAEGVREGGLKF